MLSYSQTHGITYYLVIPVALRFLFLIKLEHAVTVINILAYYEFIQRYDNEIQKYKNYSIFNCKNLNDKIWEGPEKTFLKFQISKKKKPKKTKTTLVVDVCESLLIFWCIISTLINVHDTLSGCRM